MARNDRDLIVGAATDYVESWLDGDAERMAACLHPALAKRAVADPDSGSLDLEELTFDSLVARAAAGPKPFGHDLDITVADIVGDIASVRAVSEPFVDLLHLARFGDRWLIVNALWQERPRADTPGDPTAPRGTLDGYASSWFDRDVERACSVYHPAFVERRDVRPDDGFDLEEVSIDDVVTEVSRGAPEGMERRWDAEILSVEGDIASGRIAVGPWDLSLHLARFGDRWLIVNILYLTRADP